MWRVFLLEGKQLFRGWTVAIGMALLLFAGVAALIHGTVVMSRQRAAIEESPAIEADARQAVLNPLPQDANAGDQLFYLFFHTVRSPSVWASFAIGQRDVHPFNLKVRLLALQGQLYDVNLGNPLLASLGNFDLAFVLSVIAPLLVITLTFNLRSAEGETGIWDLLRSQPVPSVAVLAVKLAWRGLTVWISLIAILGIATLAMNLPVDSRWVEVLMWTTMYVGWWMAVASLVIALGRSSDVSVLLLLGIWIVSTALGPALMNVMAATRYPLPEALELTVLQRQAYHDAWDRPLPETMAAFYERYPEWRSAKVPQDRYSNAWYYAMNQRGDEAARLAADRYRTALLDRDRWVARASWCFPPVLFDRALTRLARTDLQAHLDYLDSVASYHESLKRYFFPIIFAEATMSEVNWAGAPRHYYSDADSD